ncbi:MAG: hypothetical protein J0I54_20470 [Bosea sp.]|uniref:hypothetical protein n=1 Tax=unclassified Bosea (in: a-proteobacteria) TaxID=2653178 RepID=UPI00095C9ADE|nr:MULTISPECIES: hypothetical protein [unclassified Bosea (in: a-proteobacteria)]MBN9459014.1 hypothetical protein [Bosea sp. (in: a-proteobacteria)]OJV06243.1 MAG: hypothetical protein BGO20_08275 [Bosea sp. 67-29]
MTQTTEEAAVATEDDGWDWCVVEIFGHRRHVGRVREEERFGTKMLRIDIPKVDYETQAITGFSSHYYGGASIFSMTPTDETSAIRVNRGYAPPSRTALPAPAESPDEDQDDDFLADDDEEDNDVDG